MQAENYRIGCVGRTGQCWGTACRSRRSTCSSYKVSIKRYAPIASVAAFPERPAGCRFCSTDSLAQGKQVCHSEERSDVGISQYNGE